MRGGVGVHYLIDLYGCPRELLDDVDFVNTAVLATAREAMLTLIDVLTHRFIPQGVTSIALLAESHLSIHTWPEFGYAAIDVFSCGDSAEPERCSSIVFRRFHAREFFVRKLVRGRGVA